jgi:hypothetical protein
LPITAIRGDLINDRAVAYKQEVGKAFAEFASLRVTHKDGIAQFQF